MEQPLFDVNDSGFDVDVAIGDVALPIHVARLSQAEMIDLEMRAAAVSGLRGTAIKSDEEQRKDLADQLGFAEGLLARHVTLEPGLVRLNGAWVTTGADLFHVFRSADGALAACVGAVYQSNKLTAQMRKNWNSPRDSGAGSVPSIQPRGGDRPDSTASSAAASERAENGAVTVESSERQAEHESSGATTTAA